MFRLLSLSIEGHRVLRNVDLNFCQHGDNNQLQQEVYTSVVIGENGIGKSYLMRAISDIFSYLDLLMRNVEMTKSPVQFLFTVKYQLGAAVYEFSNMDRKRVDNRRYIFTQVSFRRNGEPVRLGQMTMPTRLIASTMTVTDKFTVVSDGRYVYKGIRNAKTPATTGTRTLIRKTVSGLLHSLDVKEGFREELIGLLEQMGLHPHLEISYTMRYKQVFLDREMTAEKLCCIFDNQQDFFPNRRSQLWGTSNFQNIRTNGQLLEKMASLLRREAKRAGDESSVILNYSVLEDPHRINEDREAIEALSAIDLLSFPSLRVYKRDDNFDFSDSSSGETHLLCQLIGIMSDIEHESLVLIDEPENSSHPNWQVSYIGWLKAIFSHYSDSHFVIATHSHFMLTDLKQESSDIIALERDENNGLRDVSDGVNTFCWSVDDILYRVFHVRNTRNYVFEQKLIDLYHLLDNKRANRDEIRIRVEELRRYRINDDDPVNKLLRMAEDA